MELLGPAESLGAGKPVVTANKHVLAHHGLELEGIARQPEALPLALISWRG